MDQLPQAIRSVLRIESLPTTFCWGKVQIISVLMVLKYAVFLLLNLCLGVSLFGNQGIKWINEDLIILKKVPRKVIPMLRVFIVLCHIHGEKGLNISLDTATYWPNCLQKKIIGWTFAMGYVNRFPPLGPDPEKVSKYYNQVFSDPDGRLVKNASVGDPVASYVIGEIFTAEELEPPPQLYIEFGRKTLCYFFSRWICSRFCSACFVKNSCKFNWVSKFRYWKRRRGNSIT